MNERQVSDICCMFLHIIYTTIIHILYIVALIGGHTLGQVRATTSGFVNQWVNFANVLNNEYHYNLAVSPTNNLAFTGYTQKRVGDIRTCINSCRRIPGNNWQWVLGNDSGLIETGILTNESIDTKINLNSDISLVLKIEDFLNETTGIVTCNAPTYTDFIGNPGPNRCPLQDAVTGKDGVLIRDIVNEYAFDNEAFINDFANVFEKMILIGERKKRLKKLIVPYDRSFEDDTLMTYRRRIQEIGGDGNELKEHGNNDKLIYWFIGGSLMIMIFVILIIFLVYYRKCKLRESIKLLIGIEGDDNYGGIPEIDNF